MIVKKIFDFSNHYVAADNINKFFIYMWLGTLNGGGWELRHKKEYLSNDNKRYVEA